MVFQENAIAKYWQHIENEKQNISSATISNLGAVILYLQNDTLVVKNWCF